MDTSRSCKAIALYRMQGAAYNVAKVFTSGLIIYLAGVLEKTLGVTPGWTVIMLIYGGIMLLIGLFNIKQLPSGKIREFTDITLKDRFKELLFIFKTSLQRNIYSTIYLFYYFVPLCRRFCSKDCTFF